MKGQGVPKSVTFGFIWAHIGTLVSVNLAESCHNDALKPSKHLRHTYVTPMSHPCHTHVTPMSHPCHTHVTPLSHPCHTYVTHMSHLCHTYDTTTQQNLLSWIVSGQEPSIASGYRTQERENQESFSQMESLWEGSANIQHKPSNKHACTQTHTHKQTKPATSHTIKQTHYLINYLYIYLCIYLWECSLTCWSLISKIAMP